MQFVCGVRRSAFPVPPLPGNSKVGGYYPQYLTEARRIGLTIRPPQVNYAEREFCV
jgi:hypothetical protein